MQETIVLEPGCDPVVLFGRRDEHLRRIRDALAVQLVARGGEVRIEGPADAVTRAHDVIVHLRDLAGAKGRLDSTDVVNVLHGVERVGEDFGLEKIAIEDGARQVIPKTPGQVRYVRAIRTHDLTLCIGPAGTGKTYLAVAMAVRALRAEEVRRIVLARPAVEAGEKLGFLPGDMQAKVNPYLRPLLDALYEMLPREQVRRYLDNDLIEIVPLAFMRGRTLNQAFIILDEAQNTTVAQMKMFLTRMGMGSKIIVTGDVTQVDLPEPTRSGLVDARHRLRRIRGVSDVCLTEKDIVRHPLVEAIVRAYSQPKTRRRTHDRDDAGKGR